MLNGYLYNINQLCLWTYYVSPKPKVYWKESSRNRKNYLANSTHANSSKQKTIPFKTKGFHKPPMFNVECATTMRCYTLYISGASSWRFGRSRVHSHHDLKFDGEHWEYSKYTSRHNREPVTTKRWHTVWRRALAAVWYFKALFLKWCIDTLVVTK